MSHTRPALVAAVPSPDTLVIATATGEDVRSRDALSGSSAWRAKRAAD
jgi:hypothetical protein